jgi:hypothetical protein
MTAFVISSPHSPVKSMLFIGGCWHVQKLVTLLCTIAAIAWVGFEAVRFHREEIAPLTGLCWVLSGVRPLVVGDYGRAFVWIPTRLNWNDFNRAVDAEASKKIIFFLSQIYDDEHRARPQVGVLD